MNDNNINNSALPNTTGLPSPDFSKIAEKPRRFSVKKLVLLLVKIVAIIAVILLIIGAIFGLIYYRNISQATKLGLSAKDNLESAFHQIINRDFAGGAATITESNGQLRQVKEQLDKLPIVRHLPYLGFQIQTVDQLLQSGIELTDSGAKVVLLIDDIVKPLQNESISISSLTPEQKKEILSKIVESESLLSEVQQQIAEAAAVIDAIPEKKLVKPLREGISPLKAYLPKVKKLIDGSLPMLHVIPQVVGFEQPKSYLFLLQNNSELRPTGGFIGTYGILKLQDGEIMSFDTDNIYNLDKAPQYLLQEEAPWQLEKYLDQKYWSLRDINWSPDFPTTAQKALYMYDKEYEIVGQMLKSGAIVPGEESSQVKDLIPYEKVDGVIAMTPELIEGLLQVTGPIDSYGIRFTAENFQDELEFQVGKRYRELGISMTERKSVIKELANQIKLRLFDLPAQRLPDLLDIALTALDQKQILIYAKDANLQQLIIERNWGGEMLATEGDYLMVVDSNLASLKTDRSVEREINYSLKKQGNEIIAHVAINYKNNADFTWKTTRLRSYTRIYVPLGSELIGSAGAMENDKVKNPENKPGQVETGSEFNKTFFGAFISIEPHETGVLSFDYKLPATISQQINDGTYSLLVQKQPGVIHDLTLDLIFGKNIKSAYPADGDKDWFDAQYNFSTAVNKDKKFNIEFK